MKNKKINHEDNSLMHNDASYLIDTHCHINIMTKKTFDTPLSNENILRAKEIVADAITHNVKKIINVGTSVIESKNCILLAQFAECYAAIGVHPNDATSEWKKDIIELKKMIQEDRTNKIVGIGECGLDYHYPDYNKNRQKDAFRAQIELALESGLPLIVHTRDAADDTLGVLDEFKSSNLKGLIHCFSEDRHFAKESIERGFLIAIGGPLTYPKNEELRYVFSSVPLSSIVLETDAPYLAPQIIRGKENSPAHIATIAAFLAQLRGISIEEVTRKTTENVLKLFVKMI